MKTKSRALAGSWQAKHVLCNASLPGFPSLKSAKPQPPVAAYFFESLTINWTLTAEPTIDARDSAQSARDQFLAATYAGGPRFAHGRPDNVVDLELCRRSDSLRAVRAIAPSSLAGLGGDAWYRSNARAESGFRICLRIIAARGRSEPATTFPPVALVQETQ